MDTKALRQKILDLAIRGKLVPQNPNDEPASVLLERIRAEKQQMVKDGKLKAKDIKNDTVIFLGDDNLHYEKFPDGTVKCIQDEIPFELPQGWEWTRLGNLSSTIQYGLSNSAESQGTHRLLRITDIQDGKVNWKYVPFTTIDNAETYLLRKDDIVFARTGATVGKSFLITELPFESVYASYLIRIRLFDCISPSYLYQFFNSHCYWEQITDKSVGVGQPNCNGTSLKELFIPLPSLNEQKRIVPAANSLLNYASVIESEKDSLQGMLNLAKSKILDLAIRGKLVPQNPDDEPASVLLERIRAEKEELIKQGKIKRDKKESVIFRGDDNSYYEVIGSKTTSIDDEIPFDLPKKWEWVRLGVLFSHNTGKALNKNDTTGIKMTYITTSNLYWDRFELDSLKEMNFNESEIEKCTVQKGDLLVCEGGDVGRAAIWNYDNEIRIQNHIHKLRPYSEVSVLLYYYVFYYYKLTDRINGKGIGIQGLSSNQLHNIFLPLPPLNEQKRIADKVSQLFSLLDSIADNVN